jgi:drug/metabolite transporter (DMT)-like permease
VLCIGQFFLLRSPAQMHVASEVLWLSLVNAVFCTFVPVVLIMLAVHRIGAPIVSQVGIIGPLSTVALSWLVLGEPLTGWVLVGTVLVLSGVWLLTRQLPPRAGSG